MFSLVSFWIRSGVALLALTSLTLPATAGWLTLKNDCHSVLVVQETIVARDGSVKRGRPTRLLPGETLREFQIGPRTKRIEVFEMKAPHQVLFSGRLTWQDDHQIFSLTSDGKSIVVVPVERRKLLPITLTPPAKP